MRTISAGLKTALSKQFGARPAYILKIGWSSGDESYSKYSWTGVKGLVKEFGELETVSVTDGIAHTSKISVTLFDPTGYLKHKFDRENLYSKDLQCHVYLGEVGETHKMLIFKGKIEDPIIYDLNTFELKFDVFYGLDKKKVCYVPVIEDIPEDNENYEYFKKALAGKAWPESFGSVKNIPIYPLMDNMELKLSEDVDYNSGPDPYTVSVEGDLCSALIADTFYTVNFIGDDNGPYIYIVAVKFSDINPDNKSAKMTFYNTDQGPTGYFLEYKWFQNISLTKVANADTEDNMQAYLTGTCLRYDGETVDATKIFIGEMFAKTKFLAPTDPTIVGYVTGQRIKVALQDKNLVTFNIPNAGAYGAIEEITYACKQNNVTKQFKKGMRILFYSNTLRNVYIIDSKSDSTLDGLYLMGPNGRVEVPSTAYTIHNSIDEPFWVGNPECLYIKMKEPDYLRAFNNNEMKDPSTQDVEALLADVTSTKKTLGACMDYLSTRYAEYPSWTNTDTVTEKVNFAILQEEDLQTILPEIALQRGYGVRLVYQSEIEVSLELVNILNKVTTTDFTFTDANIDANTFEFSFKDLSDITTKIKGTIQPEDYLGPLKYKRKTVNADQYGDLEELDFDYYAYESLSIAYSDIEAVLNYLSVPWAYVTFTGYLDSIHLELLDKVKININTINFYKNDKGSPVSLPENKTMNKEFRGRIRSISSDYLNGLIKYTVQLNVGMGDV